MENMEITRYLCPLAVCSLFYACIFMWDIDSILWKPAEKKIYILAFGFYEIFFFFPEARSPNLLQILPASLNLWKTLEYSETKVKVLVFIFFPPIFQQGNLKGKDISLPLTLVFGTLVWSKDCFSGDSGSLFQSLPHLISGDIKLKNNLE